MNQSRDKVRIRIVARRKDHDQEKRKIGWREEEDWKRKKRDESEPEGMDGASFLLFIGWMDD